MWIVIQAFFVWLFKWMSKQRNETVVLVVVMLLSVFLVWFATPHVTSAIQQQSIAFKETVADLNKSHREARIMEMAHQKELLEKVLEKFDMIAKSFTDDQTRDERRFERVEQMTRELLLRLGSDSAATLPEADDQNSLAVTSDQ